MKRLVVALWVMELQIKRTCCYLCEKPTQMREETFKKSV